MINNLYDFMKDSRHTFKALAAHKCAAVHRLRNPVLDYHLISQTRTLILVLKQYPIALTLKA